MALLLGIAEVRLANVDLNSLAYMSPLLSLPTTVFDVAALSIKFSPSSKSASRPLPEPSFPECQTIFPLTLIESPLIIVVSTVYPVSQLECPVSGVLTDKPPSAFT